MSPEDVRRRHLGAEIVRDWQQVQRHLAEAANVQAEAGPAEAALIALSLDHAYQAFEALLVRLERALGLPERGGPAWHGSLLADASLELPQIRPPVYPDQARHHWDALLRFRHFLRHAYAVPLDPEELERNRGHLNDAVTLTSPFVDRLIEALQ